MMKAALFRQPGQHLQVEQLPIPVPAPGNVLIKVHYCGICGTDLHASQSPLELESGEVVFGHEYVGQVVANGSGVSLAPGSRVCALPFLSCGRCRACVEGLPFECEHVQLTGLTVNGAFAEYVEGSAHDVLLLPDQISDRQAALIEPLAVAWHALQRVTIDAQTPVIVVGGGPIGMAVIYWCRHLGCEEIVLLEKNPARSELAITMGATQVHIGAENTEPPLADSAVIFECAGLPGVIQQCVDRAPRRGTIVVVGFCTEPDSWVPASALLKELTMEFVIAYSRRDFADVIEQMGRAADPDAMISEVVSLDQLPVMFEALKRPGNRCKVLVDCRL